MSTGNWEIAVAGAADLEMIAHWAAEEGWNPGADDRIAFAAADPHGFLIGRVGGEAATCISVIRYGGGFGFLGFYIARQPFRGQGYGLRTWQAGMARLAGRTVGLDGVVEQQANYRKSGFRPAWTNIRFEGAPDPGEPDVPGVTFADARAVPADILAAYDRRFFPADRPGFLACWLALPGRVAVVALQDGQIAGLGAARPALAGSRIGPLYAQSPPIAAALLRRLSDGTPIVLDVPQINPYATAVAEELGLKAVFETARMYAGPAPRIDETGFYGVTSLELG